MARAHNAPSAALGMQTRMVSSGTQTINVSTVNTNISGLSLALSAGGVYRVEGMLMFTASAVGDCRFGLSFPGMTRATGWLDGTSAIGQNVFNRGRFNENGSTSNLLSISAAASGTTYGVLLEALFQVSSSNGTLQWIGSISAAG